MADKTFIQKALQPLEAGFSSLTGTAQRDKTIRPTETKGRPGTQIYGGYVVELEKDPNLLGKEKYKTYSEILANTAIVAAGVRYFLNLAAGAEWSFEPPEGVARAEELAENAAKMITEDPETSWARIVRRAAMYRFHGFSLQEWVMKRGDDGQLTYADIAPRPQITIERWDVATTGEVIGVVQRNVQNSEEIYLPRGKLVYLVDDTINDSPQGLGLFRHIVAAVQRLQRYEQLEGFGYETDLRGVPVGRAPYSELRQKETTGEITREQAINATRPIETFIEKHIKNPALGLLLDSEPFASLDESGRPSGEKKFDISLLEGEPAGFAEVAAAINRVNLEIARVLGVESLMMGGEARGGSLSLGQEKTSQFALMVDATLKELAEQFEKDLIDPLWQVNGWPEEAKPKMKVEAVKHQDIDQITAAIRDLAQAGAPLDAEDPVIQEVRSLLGLTSEVVVPEPVDPIDLSLTGGEGDESGNQPVEEDEPIEDPEDD